MLDYVVKTHPDCKDNNERCDGCPINRIKYNGVCLPRLENRASKCVVVDDAFKCLSNSPCLDGIIDNKIKALCSVCNQS